jgi:uncharacterized OB-fold protein
MAKIEADPAGARPNHKFPGSARLTELVIAPNSDTARYLDMLNAGRVALQRCVGCRRCRFPIAPVCPYCHVTAFDWIASRGVGKVVSWVRYHRSYLPEFERVVPYVVLCVELAEGPRMFGRLADSVTEPRVGMSVSAIIEVWDDGGRTPAFVPAGESA